VETEADEYTEEERISRGLPAKLQKIRVAKRIQQRKEIAPLSATMFRQGSGFHEPLTPHSPLTMQSGLSSRNPSFSTPSSVCYSEQQMSLHMPHMHQPPTPQSPYYDDEPENQRPMSPTSVVHRSDGYQTPAVSQPPSVNGSFDGGLRIICEAQSPQQLLAAAQHSLQSSPGSLSSCSTSTAGTQGSDYFARAPPQSAPYQSYPISPGNIHYPVHLQHAAQHSTAPYHQSVQYQPAPFTATSMHQVPVQLQQQQLWYDVQPHQHHLISQQPRFAIYGDMGPQDLACIKQEPENTMLPTPRASFC
jgi:hypothetical protein